MGSTTHSIEVNAPLRVVYNQWTQFEEFPRFMEGVDEVRQDGPKRPFWKAKIAGKDKQWEAEITEQVPDKRITWVSVDGTPNTGEVIFESLELERTQITLTMEYEPEGFLEMAGDVLGIPSGQVEEDLKRFRDFIEGESFQTRQHPHDLTDEPTPLAANRLGEQGKRQIEYDKAGVIRPTDEKIARRAYELYLNRGQTSGHELEDWLQAEWELSERFGGNSPRTGSSLSTGEI